jgi:hypothetical protein
MCWAARFGDTCREPSHGFRYTYKRTSLNAARFRRDSSLILIRSCAKRILYAEFSFTAECIGLPGRRDLRLEA